MRTTKRLILSVAAGGLMLGCAGTGPGDEELPAPSEPPSTSTRSQAVRIEPVESSAGGANCFLVVYQPYLVWNSPTYMTRGVAYVSCPSWQPRIELYVALEDEDESTRGHKFVCINTFTCVGGANAYAPWGKWKTAASATVRSGWHDDGESDWVTLSR